jgi:hypothetical protein
MSDVLIEVKKNLVKSVSELKKFNYDKAFEIIDDSLVDLEHCYKIVDDDHEEQLFLVKECLHDMLELLELDECERDVKEIKVSLKGIKLNRN